MLENIKISSNNTNLNKNKFKLQSQFNPTNDQQDSINILLNGLTENNQQTLNGITGSGKTFVIANVINKSNKPSIVVAPNKVLAFQLYNELKELFPNDFVGYYVSNYDIYKPTYFNSSLNKKMEAIIVVNQENKALRYSVKDFLTKSEKVILVCSSTIIFPTFKEDMIDLISKYKSYIIRRLNEEKILQVNSFINLNKIDEANRLENHIEHTINMMLSNNEYYNADILSILNEKTGDFYLTDYFIKEKPNLFIDESHLTLLQFNALPKANRNRLEQLVNRGYYLNNVIKDNILNLKYLQNKTNSTTYISATPSKYELKESNRIVKLLTRPNNLIDPKIEIKKLQYWGSNSMVTDIIKTINNNETVFINCISRKSVEFISEFLLNHNIKNEVIHFKIKQDKRKEILLNLRNGNIKVIIGINMLREGIDVKHCSLVIVEEASRNNFLRTKSCLIQIAGRASRNVNGKVYMCCDNISSSLKEAVKEIDYRRSIQIKAKKLLEFKLA